jgi:tripartite-type tricarboxylate transporter receptor subunit TctC
MDFCKREWAAVMLTGTLAAVSASAAEPKSPYPARPITIVAGYPPGAGLDTLARLIARHMSEYVGQEVLIEYRPGAASNIAAQSVARAKADGYTLFIGGRPNTIHKVMYERLDYDFARDLVPVGLLATVPYVALVAAYSPIADLEDIMALAKAYPGTLTCASAGIGTSGHLVCELFQQRTGTDILHVPYRGAAPAITDLIGGRVDMQFAQLPTALPHIRAGRVRPVALLSARRLAIIQDVPTMEEAGLPGLDLDSWYGLMAPAGTPSHVVAKLGDAVNAVLMDPALQQAYMDLAYVPPLHPNTPEALRALISQETERWTTIIEQRGLKPAR